MCLCLGIFYILILLLDAAESTIRDRDGCEKIFLSIYCLIGIAINVTTVVFTICALLIFVT